MVTGVWRGAALADGVSVKSWSSDAALANGVSVKRWSIVRLELVWSSTVEKQYIQQLREQAISKQSSRCSTEDLSALRAS